jgi:hypothetical protein
VNILKNIVVNSAIMYDLKEKNLIFPLFQIIGQLEYPEENFDIKKEFGFFLLISSVLCRLLKVPLVQVTHCMSNIC